MSRLMVIDECLGSPHTCQHFGNRREGALVRKKESMCNVCFPTCGRCRPISIVTFVCLECGKADSTSREEFLMYTSRPHRLSEAEVKMHEENGGSPRLCKKCGCDLLETLQNTIKPAPCKRSNILCGFPCGRRIQDANPKNPCATMVPVGEYYEDEAIRTGVFESPADTGSPSPTGALGGSSTLGRPDPPARPGTPGRPGAPAKPGVPVKPGVSG